MDRTFVEKKAAMIMYGVDDGRKNKKKTESNPWGVQLGVKYWVPGLHDEELSTLVQGFEIPVRDCQVACVIQWPGRWDGFAAFAYKALGSGSKSSKNKAGLCKSNPVDPHRSKAPGLVVSTLAPTSIT
jgi:hypothetical protein